ncbi:winged helix-turn-helix domain-containing protein [Ancylobacter mangrovi]|uniref:winged helix-turn-helix domain-containing protein n=1 Tax=Ancylobacter mangrovi TaxID=2972472 RepID=UPI002162B7A5|nr:winged helix-turn-helix domain-containing protein [Ancylobacter mangrovi]MCS0501595.1 winged helix-turn-helix domain-containing protein [Ancylobacter mangrovi]
MDESARVEALEAESERLRQRVEQLEAAMGMDFVAPVEWRLTSSECRVFGVLLKREVATKDAIMAALYRADGREEAEMKIVDVFICKIRRKVKPFGVVIVTRWAVGWSLESRAELAQALGGGA